MSRFAGFPNGSLSQTPLPDLFFSELLPSIDDLAELKVTLHIFWALSRKKGTTKYLTLSDLLGDHTLMRSLQTSSQAVEPILRSALNRATNRGTLLHLTGAEGRPDVYLVNSEAGRRAMEHLQLSESELAKSATPTEPMAMAERPNIYALYEQNIGLLQPIIAEELKDAERVYPQAWIEEAFRIAATNNVRNWRYIQRILERWTADGKDEGKGKTRDKTWYTEEESRKFIQR